MSDSRARITAQPEVLEDTMSELARATCKTCGGTAGRGLAIRKDTWLHLDAVDWVDNPHQVDPIDVVEVKDCSL